MGLLILAFVRDSPEAGECGGRGPGAGAGAVPSAAADLGLPCGAALLRAQLQKQRSRLSTAGATALRHKQLGVSGVGAICKERQVWCVFMFCYMDTTGTMHACMHFSTPHSTLTLAHPLPSRLPARGGAEGGGNVCGRASQAQGEPGQPAGERLPQVRVPPAVLLYCCTAVLLLVNDCLNEGPLLHSSRPARPVHPSHHPHPTHHHHRPQPRRLDCSQSSLLHACLPALSLSALLPALFSALPKLPPRPLSPAPPRWPCPQEPLCGGPGPHLLLCVRRAPGRHLLVCLLPAPGKRRPGAGPTIVGLPALGAAVPAGLWADMRT